MRRSGVRPPSAPPDPANQRSSAELMRRRAVNGSAAARLCPMPRCFLRPSHQPGKSSKPIGAPPPIAATHDWRGPAGRIAWAPKNERRQKCRAAGRMTMRKWWAWPLVWAGCVLAAGLNPGAGHAEYRAGTIKIGVLNDQSGLYADIAGTASVWMARKAVEDFGAAAKGMKVEIVGGDHQNKPDIGVSIARQWLDVDKVDAIADVPTSSVALAINELTRDKNKVFLAVGPATSDLTGKACSPNTVHWIYDTWALANGTGNA